MAGNQELSPLEVQILRALSQVKDIGKLARIVKVPPATLGKEIAKLQLSGCIGDDGALTEKGLNAIRE